MKYIKLPVHKIINIKEDLHIYKPFKILNLDLVSDIRYDRSPEFGLFFDNNFENLDNDKYSHYIGFKRDPYTRDNYFPATKRTCKLFNYCVLRTYSRLDVDYVSFYIDIKK